MHSFKYVVAMHYHVCQMWHPSFCISLHSVLSCTIVHGVLYYTPMYYLLGNLLRLVHYTAYDMLQPSSYAVYDKLWSIHFPVSETLVAYALFSEYVIETLQTVHYPAGDAESNLIAYPASNPVR